MARGYRSSPRLFPPPGLPLMLGVAGSGFGSVFWIAALSAGAFAVVVVVALLAWRPHWLRLLARLS